jgi:hypothetical protein
MPGQAGDALQAAMQRAIGRDDLKRPGLDPCCLHRDTVPGPAFA